MSGAVWILGATGRSGRGIAAGLHAAGVPLVLAGRDAQRLSEVVDALDGAPTVFVGTLSAALARFESDRPSVVVNTVGPFTATAPLVTRACPPGTHYVDISNELLPVEGVLDLDRHAGARGQVFVTAAGFGVLATESVVLRLCAGQPRPTRVRVDALAALELEEGTVGTALAASIAEVAASGGREVRQGRLVRSMTGAHFESVVTPDGDRLSTGGGASGDLIAAWRASDADEVVAASTAVPASPIARASLPALTALFRIPGVSRLAVSRIARIPLHAKPMPRASSWARARVEWASGRTLEGWLRAPDGSVFTVASVVEITRRLLRGEGAPGAYTPGALFGPELAEAAGGEFVLTS